MSTCDHRWHRESVEAVNPNVIVQKVIETFRCSKCRAKVTETRYHDTAVLGRVR